jgi:hypothetical protein
MSPTQPGVGHGATILGSVPWVSISATTAQILFRNYARYIPNRTRQDGSALLARLTETQPGAEHGCDTGKIRGNDAATGQKCIIINEIRSP